MHGFFLKRYQRLFRPEATLASRHLACPCCGIEVVLPPIRQSQKAYCPRCHTVLARVERDPYISPIIYALSALLVLPIVSFMLFMTISLPGASSRFSLPGMMAELLYQETGYLANIMFVFVFATPLLFLLLSLYVYSALIQAKPKPYLLSAARLMFSIRPWLMVDIFFVAALVALVKIQAVSNFEIGPAFIALFIYVCLITRTILAVPQHWVYSKIIRTQAHEISIKKTAKHAIACKSCFFYQDENAEKCSVCGSALHKDTRHQLSLSWAFLCAAILFYIPANLLPMMITSNPTITYTNQILDGVLILWKDGDHLVAMIIFIASVLIPLFKIISMLILLLSVQYGLFWKPPILSALYHVVEWIGRWSMVDPFVIIILMASFHTPIAQVLPGTAVVFFCLVILFTILSAHYFDIRLVWKTDKAKKDTA